MEAGKIQGFILYRIYYGEQLVYLGRTKQPLQNRIRGHLFKKPMHRTLYIDHISRIEYAEFPTEADMNLYEIYFINLWKPTFNIDDKCTDNLTVSLPEVVWKPFETPLWDRWKAEIDKQANKYTMRKQEQAAKEAALRIMRQRWRSGEITEEEYYRFKDTVDEKKQEWKDIFEE